jgi:hypothetical protein
MEEGVRVDEMADDDDATKPPEVIEIDDSSRSNRWKAGDDLSQRTTEFIVDVQRILDSQDSKSEVEYIQNNEQYTPKMGHSVPPPSQCLNQYSGLLVGQNDPTLSIDFNSRNWTPTFRNKFLFQSPYPLSSEQELGLADDEYFRPQIILIMEVTLLIYPSPREPATKSVTVQWHSTVPVPRIPRHVKILLMALLCKILPQLLLIRSAS